MLCAICLSMARRTGSGSRASLITDWTNPGSRASRLTSCPAVANPSSASTGKSRNPL